MLRTHTCGELNEKFVNTEVTLCGWVNTVRNLGSLVFVDLRDKYGITQLNIPSQLFEENKVRPEDVISAKGKVVLRSQPNHNIPTGLVEIEVSELKIFSHAETTPFEIKDDTTASEDTRLQYRYLDLRRPIMQKYLQIRSDVNKYTREYLNSIGFQEIDTPTMIKSTPEGARDYLIPSRIYPGCFYALPQSPQLYKQLLMIAGSDRYFQLAHCYRDEDQRADRQPEFMQIDCELSFVDREDVLNVIEGLLKYVFKKVKNVDLPDFYRMDYADAINKYGSDKPDMRFEMLISDVTSALEGCGFKAYEGKLVKAIVISDYADKITRKNQDEDNVLAKKFRVFGVSHLKYQGGQFVSNIVKNINPDNLAKLASALNVKENDLVILCADSSNDHACSALGALRNYYGAKLGLTRKDDYKPLFVINWPLFERNEEGKIESLSNPFTRPNDEDLHYLDTDPTKIKSTSYDTVLNGVELSSGALRIYDAKVQEKVFSLLGLTDEDIEKRFGFFVKALKYGVPPEGGFGIGVERLAMELAGTDNVRDVVAFPKNLKAFEPMSQCPSRVPSEDTDILGLTVIEEKKED
ncbi:aspartate--tRNA ligase [Treponema rectale]|uniref:Aspartate--tRNA ligase n=1 Tax=Treponema rectale TaxID=744512 RepID=A0A7M1XLP4_9SPIR|nr:aspartate--tRNA ligase [Treponema rectale]